MSLLLDHPEVVLNIKNISDQRLSLVLLLVQLVHLLLDLDYINQSENGIKTNQPIRAEYNSSSSLPGLSAK